LKNKKGIKLLAVVLMTLIAVGITACSQQKEIVAKVNDVEITKEDLYNQLVSQYGTETLEALISEKIMEAEVEKNSVEIPKDKIDEEIAEMTEYYGGEEEFNNALTYYNLTMDDMKDNIATNLKLEKLLEPYIEISEEDMKAYFEQNKDALSQKEEVKASHILVDTEEEANEIKAKLDKGEDFAELAKEHSKDGSSVKGGDLGYFGRGAMVKEFEDTAFSLGIDEISEPVKSEFGYHIIKVVDKKEAKEATYEEAKDKIKDALFNQQLNAAYGKWYQEKIDEYDITRSLEQK
jgi:foldase protein PrsA